MANNIINVVNMSERFDRAIFFDNAQAHINEVSRACKNIQAVKVNDSWIHLTPILRTDPVMIEYDAKFVGNSYLAFVNKFSPTDETYDEGSGITRMNIGTFYDWEKETEDATKRALILDWDRTITMMEGFLLPQNSDISFKDDEIRKAMRIAPEDQIQEITAKDVLVYLCGGPERLAMLQTWLADVARKDIHIMIVTNNTGCVTSATLFRELVEELLQDNKDFSIICSGRNTKYIGNKGLALKGDERFDGICVNPAGGRRRKTRKSRRKQKTRKNRRYN